MPVCENEHRGTAGHMQSSSTKSVVPLQVSETTKLMAGIRSKDLSCKNKLGYPRLFASLSQQVRRNLTMLVACYLLHATHLAAGAFLTLLSDVVGTLNEFRYAAVVQGDTARYLRW